jgi:integrating conjugative element relaxase (TIGR03760 family)
MSVFSLFRTKPKNAFVITAGRRLLSPHKKKIAEIRSTVGLPRKHWNILYLKTLTNLAEYVQELPASEAHHHSGRGGLLSHTIETALNSLRIRRGKLLPPNSDAETITKHKDVWTYAVFTAALCHDLGKPITDMDIELFDKKKAKLGQWSPFKGAMNTIDDAREYAIKYRRNRIYASHERASALYAHHIVPTVGLEWIASNQEVFYSWTNILTGHSEDGGSIGSIIHEADKRSVASNLAGDQIKSSVAATTSRKPLHQRILTSLRFQIDEGLLPLNRDGAAGWIVDDKLWLVVKRVLDQVRDSMTQEGQTGIPARNDRIMDELQQYNLLIPNGDKAVWKCQVFAPDWAKAHELTMLCLSVDKVWPSADAVPATFEGTVTPLNQQQPEPQTTPENNTTNNESTEIESKTTSSTLEQPAESVGSTETQNAERQTPQPPSIDFSALASSAPSTPTTQTDTTVVTKSTADTVSDDYAGSDKPTPKNDSPAKSKSTNQSSTESNTESQQTDGKDFLNWLRDGLHQRKFKVNDVNSKIHMTQEGLFLVSPAIFRQFSKDKWSYAQKRFTKLKLHERNSNGTNIHEYMATGAKKRSMIKGFLITDTANVFPGIELPNINHKLSKVN